jgi:hypothetical protein
MSVDIYAVKSHGIWGGAKVTTTTRPIKDIFLYCRVSDDQRDTIQNQLRDLPRYAEQERFNIKETFVDPNRSGTSLDGRTECLEMLDRVRAGEVDGVLVRHSDRLTRTDDVEEWGRIYGAFQKSGTVIISPHEGVTDVTTLAGKLIEFTKGLMSAEEIKKFLTRSWGTKRRFLEEGYFATSGSWPYGYKSRKSEQKGQPPDVLHVDEEVSVLSLCQDLLCSHRMSGVAVIDHLNEKGIRTRNGKEWRLATLTRILDNPALYGNKVCNKKYYERVNGVRKQRLRPEEDWIIIEFPNPIFTFEEYHAINDALDLNSPARTRGKATGKGASRFLCLGLVRCSNCGRPYANLMTERGDYYLCSRNRKSKKQCHRSPNVRRELLDDTVWSQVVQKLTWPERMLDEVLKDPEPDTLLGDQQELDQIQQQKTNHQNAIRKLIAQQTDEALPFEIEFIEEKKKHYRGLIAVLDERADKIEASMAEVERQRAKRHQLQAKVTQLQEAIDDTLDPMRRMFSRARKNREIVYGALQGLDFATKRELLEAVVGTEYIWVDHAGQEQWGKKSWSKGHIKVNSEIWFRGTLDVDRSRGKMEKLMSRLIRPSLFTFSHESHGYGMPLQLLP